MPLADKHNFILIYPNSKSGGGCFDLLPRPPVCSSYSAFPPRNLQRTRCLVCCTQPSEMALTSVM